MNTRDRVWLKHHHREPWEYCPLCAAPLRWVYDGDQWIPCDREPALYTRNIDAKALIVVKKELVGNCEIWEPGKHGKYSLGLLPHVYSCDLLDGWGGVKVRR